jgi:RNA polymerase sigma factor for flagellar operon FliA
MGSSAKSQSPAPGAGSGSTKAKADAPEVVQRVRDELPLVDIIAKQLRGELGGRVMLDELVSHGREGLLSAARSFDPSLGVPFRRWANYRVRGAMIDGVRSQSSLPRSIYARLRALEAAHLVSEQAHEDSTGRPPSASEEADARLSEYLAGIATAVAVGLLTAPSDQGGETLDPTPSADAEIERQETLGAIRLAMAELPEQERHLVQRHYFDDVRLDHAAEELGLSKSWGSRLHARAIEGITRHMKRAKALR